MEGHTHMVVIENLRIESPEFAEFDGIPDHHTGEGADVSPHLRWSGLPEGTRELAVICHDPDAPVPGGWTHWVVYGIPIHVDSIARDGGEDFTHGINDFGNSRYNGPMPPPGHGKHHYYFWVYALDTELNAEPGLTRNELLARMSDHIIEQARVVGTYER